MATYEQVWFHGVDYESADTRLANAVSSVLADAADTLGLAHITVDGDRVNAFSEWTGPGLYDTRTLAFVVVVQ